MRKINSILISNRGEIASRIIRTCRKMGIRSIAVFSEADRNALFVEQADLAVFIGESNPAASYLDQNKIIQAAKNTGADAIHPGYGFLSENVHFAKRCAKEKIIFIGPNVEAIEAMGSKSKAKTLMIKNKVPVVPGYQGEDQTAARLKKEAKKIGFPVLLKATAGGGGKGMRIVENENKIEAAIQSAKRESKAAFGDDELIVEKYIASGRHIEFQIFGDQHGNVIHLLERECTIQRRYQKIIEESPSSIMETKLRETMGNAAVNAAKALAYDNAGTVEFIYDDQSGDFYFLEVNTRLQVEHPVTEEITGLDLVQLQIESAEGEKLSVKQNDVKAKGYAIEVRLYAEDASNDFLPVTGTIEKFECPEVTGLRIETAVQSGSVVSVFYDPMIAKLIVWEETREAAHRKMAYVLRNMTCMGMTTNQNFLLQLVEHDDFKKGNYDTHFIDKRIDLKTLNKSAAASAKKAAMLATLFDWKQRENKRELLKSIPSGWRNNFNDYQKENYLFGEELIEIKYRFLNDEFTFLVGEASSKIKLIDCTENKVRIEINGLQESYTVIKKDTNFYIHNESIGTVSLIQKDRFPIKKIEKEKGVYEAPMPSQIISVLVKKGQKIKAGDGLLILSSMKMETTLEAEETGLVEEVYVEAGMNVEAGFLLLKLSENKN